MAVSNNLHKKDCYFFTQQKVLLIPKLSNIQMQQLSASKSGNFKTAGNTIIKN